MCASVPECALTVTCDVPLAVCGEGDEGVEPPPPPQATSGSTSAIATSMSAVPAKRKDDVVDANCQIELAVVVEVAHGNAK